MRRVGRGLRAGAVLVCLAVPLAGCGTRPGSIDHGAAVQPVGPGGSASPGTAAPTPRAVQTSPAVPTPTSYAVPAPGPLRKSLLTADILVTSSRTIPAKVRHRVDRLRGVAAALPISLASLSANGRTLTIAAADPGQFRRFTPVQSAQSDGVWNRVAGGEIAVDPSLPTKLEEPAGYVRLGSSENAPTVHIGAYAPMVKQISAVVDNARAKQLGMPHLNALLISTGKVTPSAVTGRLKRVLGTDATMQTLALEFKPNVAQTAVLTGASVSAAVGTFTYTPHADGTVTPDPSWVSAYIRRETVPIIGSVTCNKGMLPQLQAALTEVVQRGLSSSIHPSEYGGCYVPRFIAHDPAKGLSLHSWGMAVDLNVPGNERGTVGQMDRRVVAIFKKWGFAWGGDWNYTDPMHFELERIVRPG